MESGKIKSDLACRKCGYNLRGLPFDHQCPECGEPTLATVTEAPSDVVPEADDARHELRARKYRPVAEHAGCSVDAVLFVRAALLTAFKRAKAAPGAHVTAAQVCDGIRAHARWYFNDEAEAKELLAEWGIRRSEDVGRIVYAMVREGILKRTEDDSVEQFNGLFTLETLFDFREFREREVASEALMGSGKIDSDLACWNCGYNLRGLPFDHQCPECGESTLESVAEASRHSIPEAEGARHALRARRVKPIAEAAGCSVDAVMFVADAMAGARWLANAGPGTHITAQQICAGFRAHAISYFDNKAEAIDRLSEWGIRSSEDLGRIIFAAVEKGNLRAGKEDSIEQFNGLFTLDTLFDSGEQGTLK